LAVNRKIISSAMIERDRQCTLYRTQMSSWCALDFKDFYSQRASLYLPYSQVFVI